MKLPTCGACGAVRSEDLVAVAPCEQCGAPPHLTTPQPRVVEPGWDLSDLGRRRVNLVRQDRPWSEYPRGTLAHACTGGAWLRVAGGWQWNGHRPNPGDTFTNPGGDAVGACIELPSDGG